MGEDALGLPYVEWLRFRPSSLLDPAGVIVDERLSEGPGLHRGDAGPAFPHVAVLLDLEQCSGDVAAGLATVDDEHVLVRATRRSLLLEVRRDGRTTVLRRRLFRPPSTWSVGFVLCGDQVTALADTGRGFRPVLTERARLRDHLDLRDEQALARHRFAWQVEQATGAHVRAGAFGGVGLRDPHLVQHADGSPYQRDGRFYLTWTAAGLGHFGQAHWTVWSFDPTDPRDMRLQGHLLFRRDGRVLGDHAGQLVYDDGTWLVAVSSWGDFGERPVHVRHTRTRADLLTGVHVLASEPVALPTTLATWDPTVLRWGGAWWVAFVESESQDPFLFRPALARTTQDRWTDGLARSGGSTAYRQCEGPRLVGVAGERAPLLVASDEDSRSYPLIDSSGHAVGSLDAPYPSNIPHPQLVPDPRGGWWLITFDGTSHTSRVVGYGGHGDVVVMHSTPAPVDGSRSLDPSPAGEL